MQHWHGLHLHVRVNEGVCIARQKRNRCPVLLAAQNRVENLCVIVLCFLQALPSTFPILDASEKIHNPPLGFVVLRTLSIPSRSIAFRCTYIANTGCVTDFDKSSKHSFSTVSTTCSKQTEQVCNPSQQKCSCDFSVVHGYCLLKICGATKTLHSGVRSATASPHLSPVYHIYVTPA